MAERGSGGGTWWRALVQHEPEAGAEYPSLLVVGDPQLPRWRDGVIGIGGALLGLFTFLRVAPLVVFGVQQLCYLLAGSPGTWASYQEAAASFALPTGMLASHLGLATLIPISFALVLFVHRFNPRWLHSVQPGFRWRYALVATLAAFVVLGGIWALSRIGQSWSFNPEPQFWWFLLVILLTAPLQAAAEEYFFRGYLLQAIHSTAPVNHWFGIIGSAAIFAFMHGGQNLPLFLHRFAFGLLAGWLVMKTGGLEAGIAAHVVNNVLAFGYAAISGTMVATKTATQTGWLDLVWNLVGFGAFVAVAVFIGRRMNLATTTPTAQFGAAGVGPVK